MNYNIVNYMPLHTLEQNTNIINFLQNHTHSMFEKIEHHSGLFTNQFDVNAIQNAKICNLEDKIKELLLRIEKLENKQKE